jgi:hypothetical protein
VLVGCGIGCGALVLVAVVAAISFGVWVKRPGEPLEPRRLLGPDATGYVEWHLALDDPGTKAFVDRVVERARELQSESEARLPSWLRSWLASRREREMAEDVQAIFPVVLAWTATEAGAAEHHLVTVSLMRAGNRLKLIDWGLGFLVSRDDDTEVISYEDEQIYRFPLPEGGSFTFFLRGSDLFIVSDPAAARRAVDRLRTADAAPATPTALDRLFDATAKDAPLRGACTNDTGQLARLWRTLDRPALADEAPWDEALGLTLTGRLQGDGALVGTLELIGPDPEWAALHASTFADALRQEFSVGELEVELTGTADGERVRIDYRVPDLPSIVGGITHEGVEIDSGSGRIRVDL